MAPKLNARDYSVIERWAGLPCTAIALKGLIINFHGIFCCIFQRWPIDHKVHVWMPTEGWKTESNCGGDPPGAEMMNKYGTRDGTNTGDGHVTGSSNQMLKKGIPSLLHTTCASCVQPSDNGEAAASGKLTSLANNVQGHPHWSHRTFSVIGFSLSLNATPFNGHPLSMSLWPNTVSKGSFLKYG